MKILGKNKEAREYIDRALELNPHSRIMYNLSSSYYYEEGAYEEAIEESMKALEIGQFTLPLQRLVLCNFKLGRDQEAIKHLKEIVSIDASFDSPEVLDSILLESGRDGILRWYIHWLQTNESPDFYYKVNLNSRLARLFCLIGDSQLAMECLEKAFETGESSMPGKKFDRDFELLKDDPRFKAMFRKMGL